MNKIEKAFQDNKAFIGFLTGGDPNIETTEKLIVSMAEGGADIIEIGIPFSDPIAEGPVIQEASLRSLQNGCTTDKLFDMVKRVRNKVSIPLLFMTYANIVFGYGKESFMKRCKECGIDGLIIPDAPFEEREEFMAECEANDLTLIQMVAPTSKERAVTIGKEAKGFLYCVSSLGVTGVRSNLNLDIKNAIEEVKKVTDVPCAIGFGISTPEQAHVMSELSDGVIVGSAIVKLIAKHKEQACEPVKQYIQQMKAAL